MGFVRKNLGVDLTGGGAARAAESAAANSAAAGRDAANMLREASAPFAQIGTDAGNLLSQFINDPSQAGQSIMNNPFFRQLAQEQEQSLLSERAALGLAGSGWTGDALQRNLLSLGNNFMQQRFNNLFNTTQMGANAAIGSATGQGNILQNVANVEGVGMMARPQQQAQLGGQFMQLAGTLGGAALAGPLGGLFGGAMGGSAIGAAGAGVPGIGAGASGMAGFSDRRLKREIKKVSSDKLGGIYRFKYIDSEQVYEGRMADELQKTRPESVSVHESGYLKVTEEFAPRAI